MGVIPFIIAETITRIIWFFTRLLSIPPISGVGMIVDLTILFAGIISYIVIYKKSPSSETYEKDMRPPILPPRLNPLTQTQPEAPSHELDYAEIQPPSLPSSINEYSEN